MRKLLLLIMCLSLGNKICFASEEELRKEIEFLKKRVEKLEKKLSEYEKNQSSSSEKTTASIKENVNNAFEGLKISGGATFVLQTALDTNATDKLNEDVTDGSYSADIMLEKDFENYGKVFIHLESGDGNGLDNDEVNLFSGVNRDAGDSDNRIEVTEAWYEHYLLDGKLALTFGKLDPTCYLDQSEIANDETTQFLSSAFRNSAALEFPDNSPGIHLNLQPYDFLELDLSFLDADSDWEDLFDDAFLAFQIDIKPAFWNRDGNYRFYIWENNTGHTKWLDSGKTKESNYGAGLSWDQELTDYLISFLRFGWQDPDVSTIEYAWSTGIQINGDLWQREKDYLGVAVGENIPSDDYGEAGNSDDSEGHFELYYSYKVNPHLTLAPDFQLIWNPYGRSSGERSKTIKILGLRAQVDF